MCLVPLFKKVFFICYAFVGISMKWYIDRGHYFLTLVYLEALTTLDNETFIEHIQQVMDFV